MPLAVLAAADSWYYRDLERAADGRTSLVAVSFAQLAASVGGAGRPATAGSVDLEQCEAVLVRSMPPASLEQVVFRMDQLGRLAARGHVVVNSPRALEAAVDKYLTTACLEEAGLLVPETIVCQTVEQAVDAMAALGGDVVVKPLFGGEGRGITRVSDEAIAIRVFKTLAQLNAVLYIQRFVPHDGEDWRLLVVGDEVFGMRRRNRNDWRTNVSRGAVGEPLEVTDQLATLARRAAAAVDASVAGVDLLPGNDGRLYALEVNGVPGWKALARVTGIDVAHRVLQHVMSLRNKPPL